MVGYARPWLTVRRTCGLRPGAPAPDHRSTSLSFDQSSMPTDRRVRRDSRRSDRPYQKRGRRPAGRRPAGGPRDRRTVDPARRAAVDAFDLTRSAFPALGVPDRVARLLGVDGITAPTPVQAAVIPDAIAGRDVLGRARTGSGKTLAFGLPMLMRLAGARSRPHHPRGVIIVPTRELANQVTSALEPVAEALNLRMVTVYGGAPYDRQIRRLSQGVDVVVATPGRLDDLVGRGICRLDDIEIVTLDEADHLCDLGFYPVVSELLAATPAGGQRLLLSATLDGDVDRLVRKHLVEPVRHEIDPDQSSITEMDHHVVVVGSHNKLEVTTELVRANPRSIVFTRTKHAAMRLAEDLEDAGVAAVDLHGDLSQRVRERNLDRFRSGRAKVVVATDVAARGIHVDGVGMVVHYDPAGEAKSYLHRSGRTARAGASGAVVTVANAGQARQMTGLYKRAGVDAKHVDARHLVRPMTAEALAGAPAMAIAAAPRGGSSRGGPRRAGGSSGSGGYRGRPGSDRGFGGGPRGQGRNGSRGYGRRRDSAR
jgi:superfamily II DNA/RNA helicase